MKYGQLNWIAFLTNNQNVKQQLQNAMILVISWFVYIYAYFLIFQNKIQ